MNKKKLNTKESLSLSRLLPLDWSSGVDVLKEEEEAMEDFVV